jgi:hypothetical protein
VISATENSKKNSKKPGFGRKNQFENVATLESLPFIQFKHDFLSFEGGRKVPPWPTLFSPLVFFTK